MGYIITHRYRKVLAYRAARIEGKECIFSLTGRSFFRNFGNFLASPDITGYVSTQGSAGKLDDQ